MKARYGIVILSCLAVLYGMAGSDGSQWISFNQTKGEANYAISLLYSCNYSVMLRARFAGMLCSVDGDSTTINIEGLDLFTDQDRTSIPVLRRLVEVPDGTNVSVQVSDEDWFTLNLNDQGLPTGVIPFNKQHAKSSSLEPGVTARIAGFTSMKGKRFARIEIFPVRYDRSTGILRCTRTVDLRIAIFRPPEQWPVLG